MPIYVHRNNQQLGPYTAAEVRSQLANGALSVHDHVWWQGQEGWTPLGESPVVASNFEVPGAVRPAPKPLTGTSPMAIGSLVCGCFSLLFWIVTALPAIVLGHLALREIKKNRGRTGRGLAIAGLVIGYIMTLLTIALIGSYFMFLPDIAKMTDREEALEEASIPTLPTHSLPPSNVVKSPAPAIPHSVPVMNSAPTSTNTPATNAPAASTNAAPMSQ